MTSALRAYFGVFGIFEGVPSTHRQMTPTGLSSVPPGSVAAACTADYACTIFPTKTLSDPGACGVTNRRGIKLCHQILTSNYARTDQLHGGGRFARETAARHK